MACRNGRYVRMNSCTICNWPGRPIPPSSHSVRVMSATWPPCCQSTVMESVSRFHRNELEKAQVPQIPDIVAAARRLAKGA